VLVTDFSIHFCCHASKICARHVVILSLFCYFYVSLISLLLVFWCWELSLMQCDTVSVVCTVKWSTLMCTIFFQSFVHLNYCSFICLCFCPCMSVFRFSAWAPAGMGMGGTCPPLEMLKSVFLCCKKSPIHANRSSPEVLFKV